MKFIVVLTMMLSTTFGMLVTADNIQNFLPSDHVTVADYITENLDLFSEKYGEADNDTATVSENSDAGAEEEIRIEEAPFTGTSVEYRTVVTLTDGGDATYLDFNDECGYMLVADGYNLMEFKTSGDLAWARDQSGLYFDKFDGFMIMVDGELVAATAYFASISEEELADAGTGWTGQESKRGGWSKIYGANLYLNERYGGNYKVTDYGTLANYDSYYTQSMFTGYLGGVTGGEPNCVPVATYNILNYFRTVRGYTDLPGGSTPYDFRNDQNAVEYRFSGATSLGTRSLPLLYQYARSAAYENGYSAAGLPYGNVKKYLQTLDNYIPYDITLKTPLISSMTSVVANVMQNIPTLLVIGDYFTYGALHAVAAVEYRYYEYTKKLWVFKTTYRKPMIGIDDGQTRVVTAQKIRFIDYTGYMNSCGNPVFKAIGISLS